MSTLYERSLLEAIECHELFGNHDVAQKLTKEFRDKKSIPSENEREVIKKIVVLKE